MRLWIDGQCLQTASRLRGIGRYVTELIRAISENHPDVELSISFNAAMPDKALLAREAVRGIVDGKNIHVWHGVAKAGEAEEGYTPERRLSELAIAHHVNCLAPDVALSASPFEGVGDAATPLLPERNCRAPMASIFYDAIPYRYAREYLNNPPMKAYYLRRLMAYPGFSDNLCISEFSKSELESIHEGASATNIAAGISSGFIEIAKTAHSVRNDLGKFILYVGAFDWRKNVAVIVKAFTYIDRESPDNDLKLVLAGDGPEPLVEAIRSLWANQGLAPDRLVILGHVSDKVLVGLYKQARVVVQPSLMEGFGLTALEAIYCGTPVAAARAGALPEVIGPDEWLFDPNSPEHLARVVVPLLSDNKSATKLLERAQAHAARFTWKHSAAIAVERLQALVRIDNDITVPSSRTQISKICDRSVDLEIAARCLALSEPVSSKRRLLIDVSSTVQMDHKTGIQRVVKNICAAFANSEQDDIETRFLYSDDEDGWYAVDGRKLTDVTKSKSKMVTIGRDVLLMLDSSWHLFDPHRRHLRACRLRGGEVISCLYDTVPLRFQAVCNPAVPPVFAQWFKSALTWSTGFVCISRAVADELLAMLEAIEFPRRMKVGHWQLGADFAGEPSSSISQLRLASRTPRFLMVGTLEPRKGHRVALEAFEALWKEGVDAELVIIGKTGWGIEHLAQRVRNHREFGKRLIWSESVNDEELSRHYAECDALIAASFAEGFGLPIVEAGHFHKPVLASDIPVFREVSKGAAAAHFFKVGAPTSLASTIQAFLKDIASDNAAASVSAPIEWPNWTESAAQLQDVVLGRTWYKIYEPRTIKDHVSLEDFGKTRIEAPLAPKERAHALQLVERPVPINDGKELKVVVAVTNLSSVIWSSAGAADGTLGVSLSFHILDYNGTLLQFENPRTPIPFVHIPGDTHHAAVNVPAFWKNRGAGFVDIELVQEGVAWFGSPLRVAI